jgi:hypothetical protein
MQKIYNVANDSWLEFPDGVVADQVKEIPTQKQVEELLGSLPPEAHETVEHIKLLTSGVVPVEEWPMAIAKFLLLLESEQFGAGALPYVPRGVICAYQVGPVRMIFAESVITGEYKIVMRIDTYITHRK